MESDIERSIILSDGGDHAQGSNVAANVNPSSSTVKINSLSIDLGIVNKKGGTQKCSHFSLRGYAAKMRERGGYDDLRFADGTGELPPLEVPHFRYWLCQSCLQDYGGGSTSQEVALVSQLGKSVVQPCATSYSAVDCNGLPTLPFGEGTSGLKPVEKSNDDKNIPTVLEGDTAQSLPGTPAANDEETAKFDSVDANDAAEASVDDENHLRDDDTQQTRLADTSVQSDQLNDDPSGHPRRKARKVRLLTELLCKNTEEQQQRKESNLPESNPRPSSPLASSQTKRKMPQAPDRRYIDVTSQGHVGKKLKVSKGDAAVKTSLIENPRDPGIGEDGHNTDKYQCKKHGTQRSLKSGKVGSDPVAAWRSIFSDMGRSSHDVSQGRGTDPFSNQTMPPPQPPKKTNSSKKILENPLEYHLFGEDIQRENFGGTRIKDHQMDTGLGLGLSLHYDPQSHVSSLSQMPNRLHVQDHSRKAGFFFGENFAHRVASDPQAKARSVYEFRDGYPSRPALPQEQQHYHNQLSHGNFPQHQNLDFSDPHNKTNSGYSDVHQRQEMFSNGRSDEKEIAELMAKFQHERNLSEARGYCIPGAGINSGIPNSSSFRNVNFNQGMPIGQMQQYPTMRKPPINPASFFHHQEPLPAFPSFNTFPQYRNQPSNGIRVSDSGHQRRHASHYYDSRGNNNKTAPHHHHQASPSNMQIMEPFSKYRDRDVSQQNATPENIWSSVTNSIPAFVHNVEMHNKWSNRNKGKSVMNLDLNVMAPNAIDEHNHYDVNSKHMGSLDSSYSNEAIPAMQLLSLMDAGKSSLPFNMDGKKFTALKPPFSPCYNHCSTGEPNFMESGHFTYSGIQTGVQKPSENSRHFVLGHGTSSTSSAATNSFSPLFHTDQTPSFHKKPRGISSAAINHNYSRPDDSFAFPLPWHANEDSLGPRNVTLAPEVCTINQNPADFTIPGPENTYMINYEDLKFRGERFHKSKFALGYNADGQNRQKKATK